jgi:hypothetical protein
VTKSRWVIRAGHAGLIGKLENAKKSSVQIPEETLSLWRPRQGREAHTVT